MLIDIDECSKEYEDAYNYILSSFENDLHLHSAFCGEVFERTLKMLRYDLYGKDCLLEVSGINIDRISLYKNNEVRGVAISARFNEFMHMLNYEEYIIIIADDYESFKNLYDRICLNVCKYELITFREREREYLRKLVQESEIHFWKLYDVGTVEYPCGVDIKYAPFSMVDIQDVSIKETDENTPSRYYSFSMSGMNKYKVWTLYEEKGIPVLVASIMPYFKTVAEIKLFIVNIERITPMEAALFMKMIVSKSSDIYESAVFRVKNASNTINDIIKFGKFKCISEEQHIHVEKGI